MDAMSVSDAESLNDLRDLCLQIAKDHGFTDASIGEDIALIHSELSEALEEHRKGRESEWIWYENEFGGPAEWRDPITERLNKPCGIPIEMADAIIRILHFCGKHDIDIGRAVLEKIEYNKTRPYKHNKTL